MIVTNLDPITVSQEAFGQVFEIVLNPIFDSAQLEYIKENNLKIGDEL